MIVSNKNDNWEIIAIILGAIVILGAILLGKKKESK